MKTYGVLMTIELLEGDVDQTRSWLCQDHFFGIVSGSIHECLGKMVEISAKTLSAQDDVSLLDFKGQCSDKGACIEHTYFKGPVQDAFSKTQSESYRRPKMKAIFYLREPEFV